MHLTPLQPTLGRRFAIAGVVAAIVTTGWSTATATVAHGSPATDVYDAVVLADAPSGYWPLREPSGTSAGDLTGGVTGSVEGSAAFGTFLGPVGTATALDLGGGGCDGVNLDAAAGRLHPGKAVTVEGWIKTSDSRALGVVFRARDGGYNLLAGASGVDLTRYPADKTLHTVGNLADDHWHQVVGTYAADGYHVYVDGTLRGSGANDGDLGYFGSEV